MGDVAAIRGETEKGRTRGNLQSAMLDPDQWGSLWRLYETLAREVAHPWSIGMSHHRDGGADIHITILAPAEDMQSYTDTVHAAFVECKLRNFVWDGIADDAYPRDDHLCEREHYICCAKRRECKT